MGIETFGVFMLATLALNLTPGPDMLYVLGRSMGQGGLGQTGQNQCQSQRGRNSQ